MRQRMIRMGPLAAVVVLAAFVNASPVRAAAPASDSLVEGFANPPRQARLRAYWWWLNGNVTKAAITRDLEEMAAKGFGGALICDAGGAEQEGNNRVPHGPDFFSPEWRELYKHTLREADRLGLEMSLNIHERLEPRRSLSQGGGCPQEAGLVRDAGQGPGAGAAEAARTEASPAVLPRRGSRRLFCSTPALGGGQLFRFPSRGRLGHITPAPPELGQKGPHQSVELLRAGHLPPAARVARRARRGRHPRRPGARSHGEDGRRWHPALGESRRRVGDPAFRLHAERPLPRLDVQRRLAGLRPGRLRRRRFPPVLGRGGRAADRRCGPLGRTRLKYLHTDSWEVEVANWTPTLRAGIPQPSRL